MTKRKFTKANVDDTVELVYNYITEYIKTNGFSPTVRDLCKGTGIRSTSTIHAHLKRLRDSGRIDMEAGKRRALTIAAFEQQKVDHIPLVGRVAAGVPILAEENIDSYLPVPAAFYTEPEHMFALEITGDSMIGAGILNGDYVFVKKQAGADYGDIVVALIDDEATVKTLAREQGRTVLKPENPSYKTIPFDQEGCLILGVVRGVWRAHV
ncbi:MAG TPA: transcriptional repressor LexA [Clostridiaceae bacterium]|nr:transcriptional repressor LexA [Clostridiaceae bacterium]